MADSALPALPRVTLAGSRREMLIGAGCLAAAAVAFARRPHDEPSYLGTAKLENIVPTSFAGWRFATESGLVLPPQDQLASEVYHQLLTRVYDRADGQQVMLLIAYGGAQGGVIQIHRPEICYPASGFTLTTVKNHSVPLAPGIDIPSRFIIADSPNRREEMIYWTRLGNRFPRRWSEQRLAVFEQNLAGIVPDGVLVRISSDDPQAPPALLDSFAAELYAAGNRVLRTLLAGHR